MSDAIWLNGYAVHARFQDDCDMASWTHPGSLVVPAALSVAEAAGASLERALTGIVCGYSVLHWLGAAEQVGRAVVARAFRASPTLGPVAAAAAAVLELSAEQAANALAIAASSAGGVIETVRSGSSDWRFQNGSAAWRGAVSALLAREGVDGAPEVFESDKGFVRAFAGLAELPRELSLEPEPESIRTVWAKAYPTLGDNVAVASAAVGHYENKAIVEPGVMVARIQAALDARVDPSFIVIARTDARAVEGLEAALTRSRRYAEAGADMLFVEAPQSEHEIEAIADAFDTPLVINMFQGGKTPLLPASRLQELGYSLMLVPSDLQRAAIHGMQRAAEALLGEGSTASFAGHMVSFAERERLVELETYVELDDRYAELETRQ